MFDTLNRVASRGVCLGVAAALSAPAFAADHTEAPGATADPAADIADFYAWNTDDGKIVAAITVGGLGPSEGGAIFDADVLYGVHIDQNFDNVPDLDVWLRFGQSSDGDWGVQVSGLPGGDPVVEGPVEAVIDAGGDLRVYAGLRDDPFFFDQAGFLATLDTQTVAFDNTRDSVARLSVTAMVIEMAAGSVLGDQHDVQIWTTSSRK